MVFERMQSQTGIILLLMSVIICGESLNSTNKRPGRSLPLLFRNNSATTFIFGIGIPVNDLDPELVTVGMVFKAQQILPTTFQALKMFSKHRIERHSAKKYENNSLDNSKIQYDDAMSKHRTFFYKALEQLSTSLGQQGHDCVLKMICEAATIPFHYRNGVLGELLYILMTPSSSFDFYKTNQDAEYMSAENFGKNRQSCGQIFRNCKESILEHVTSVYD